MSRPPVANGHGNGSDDDAQATGTTEVKSPARKSSAAGKASSGAKAGSKAAASGTKAAVAGSRPAGRADSKSAAPAGAKGAGPAGASAEASSAATPVRPATKRPKATRLRQPAQPGGTPVARRKPAPSAGADVLGTAVQAAAELAEIGLSVSARALRRAVSRLPRP